MNRRSGLKRSGMKPCAACDAEFLPYMSTHKYCSRACAHQEERACAHCGKTFRCRRDAATKVCSLRCRDELRFGGTYPKMLACQRCGTVFRAKRPRSKYCSHSCACSARWDRDTDTPRKWRIESKREKVCRNCGKPARHLHHIVPRSKSKTGATDWQRNGLPLCFDCHRGWHDRKVTIPMTRLRMDELARAVELAGPVWVERNYPFLTFGEQAELYLQCGSLGASIEDLGGQWTREEVERGEAARSRGEQLPEAVLRECAA